MTPESSYRNEVLMLKARRRALANEVNGAPASDPYRSTP